MFIGSLYLLLAAAFCLVAVLTCGAGWILLWPGGCFAMVALTYYVRAPWALGKSDTGQISRRHRFALWPYFLFCQIVWSVLTTFRKEDPFNEISPGIVIGRRLLAREYPGCFDQVIDLTAEFTEPVAVRTAGDYRSFPILDASVPSARRLIDFVRSLDNLHGTTFIHCAVGHGRSGMFCAVLLLAKQRADTPDEALQMIYANRPGVWLRKGQRRIVDQAALLLGERLPAGE